MIHSESQYKTTLQALDRKSQPPGILKALMNVLESYRASRRIGWSRPQNKAGVRTFKTLVPTESVAQHLSEAIFHLCSEPLFIDGASQRFVEDLLIDPKLMQFMFFHDVVEAGRQYEGVTLSFGRRVGKRGRYRDRLDVILESEVIGGVSRGFSRLRIYVDPYQEAGFEVLSKTFSSEHLPANAHLLFAQCTDLFRQWSNVPERIWEHWTQDYVDYFGPRHALVGSTHFPTGEFDDAVLSLH